MSISGGFCSPCGLVEPSQSLKYSQRCILLVIGFYHIHFMVPLVLLGKFMHWCNDSTLFHEGYEYSKTRESDVRAPLNDHSSLKHLEDNIPSSAKS